MTKFFGRGALEIVVVGDIFDNLARGILLIVEEVGERNPWRSRLLSTWSLLFSSSCCSFFSSFYLLGLVSKCAVEFRLAYR